MTSEKSSNKSAGAEAHRDEEKLSKLRRLNLVATVFFAAQVVILLLISEPARLPVVGEFLTDAPGSGMFGVTDIVDLRIDLVVALFLLLAAIDHFAVGTFARRWYEGNITRGHQPGPLVGVLDQCFDDGRTDRDAGGRQQRGRTARAVRSQRGDDPFRSGHGAGEPRPGKGRLVALHLRLRGRRGAMDRDRRTSSSSPTPRATGSPVFVYIIFVTLFVLFNGFAVNMWLGYRANGRWQDPLFVERAYIMLSFVAKTALAWQVYQGALAGA